MKALVPTKSVMQKLKEEYDAKLKELVRLEHDAAINLAIVTRMAADIDEGLDEEVVVSTTKRWRSYIDSVHSDNVSLQEIKDALKEDYGIDFSWMDKKDNEVKTDG